MKENIQEDEIDLKELFKVIYEKRKFILIFTFIVTTLSIIFIFFKTPIYEAKAVIEIGSYKEEMNKFNSEDLITKISLENVDELSKKLNVIFIDLEKNLKDKKATIEFIKPVKNLSNFIEINSTAISNELAKNKILDVINYIRSKHKKILDDIYHKRKMQIKNIESRIENLKAKEIPFYSKKINYLNQNLISYKNELKKVDKNLSKIENSNPSLAALILMQKRELRNIIESLNLKIFDLKDAKDKIETVKLNKLLEEKNFLNSMLLPHNYKNSEVIGKVLINDYPIKPKKKLIVMVAFVTSLILSVFIVFLINFILSMKEEKNE